MEIVYNNDNLKEEDITSKIIRVKGLIINDDNILLGNENNVYQFPGGHLESNENLIECLKREVMEETGITLQDDEISPLFMKIVYYIKNYPAKNLNRKYEIYYYIIKTDKYPDLSKTNYTAHEKSNNFKIELVRIKNFIKLIENKMAIGDKNSLIARDMITVVKEYKKQLNK